MKLHSIRRFKVSVGHALRGIKLVAKEEINFRFHLIFAGVTMFVAWLLSFERLEWLILLAVIGLVLVLEIINTAIERLADFISPGEHLLIKNIKDLSAAAVLMFSLIAMVIGILLFVPKLISIFQNGWLS